MTTPETSPEACAERILADTGGRFASGPVGDSVYHFFKGLKDSPRGGRLADSIRVVGMNVPSFAAKFGYWGGILSTCGCAMVVLQHKEDPLNSLITAASRLFSTREGASPSPAPPSSLPTPPPSSLPTPSPSVSGSSSQSSSWFGGLFGKKQ